MAKLQSLRPGCKDVFNAFLVRNADYEGYDEIPVLRPTYNLPNQIITFSKAVLSQDYDQWVCFYEDDAAFVRLWNNPTKYLPILKRFNGIITPDFSLYQDMPLCMQKWNIYRSRAIGVWLQENGVKVIPNIRWADFRTHRAACLGISTHSVISIGSHGALKDVVIRKNFVAGLDYVIHTLSPSGLVVYGAMPEAIFGKYENTGITIVQFDASITQIHKAGDA